MAIRRRPIRPTDLLFIVLPAVTTAVPAPDWNGAAADIVNDAALWKRDDDYDDDEDEDHKKKKTKSPTPTPYPTAVRRPVEQITVTQLPKTWSTSSTTSRSTTSTTDAPSSDTIVATTTTSTSASPSDTALPGAADPAPEPAPTQLTGNSNSHVKMEIGIACGVIGAFLIISVAIFFYMRRRRGSRSAWSTIKNPFGGPSNNMPRSVIEEPGIRHAYESRTNIDYWPSIPDPVMLGANDIKRLSDAISESSSDIERLASIKRKYTISRSIDMPREMPPPVPGVQRSNSDSSYTTMSVLPDIPSSAFDDSFLESIERPDPFADPYSPTTASIPAPLPLRIPQKATIASTADSVTSMISPQSPPKGKKGPRDLMAPAPLRITRPPQNQIPWTEGTAGRRDSDASIVDSEGPARHRNVKSWVSHEADIRDRYPVMDEVRTPLYVRNQESLYNRLSINSGLDTRRTEYEYYMG
ncbi:hypothetical protein DRE_01770 [Drechslerella stenobrocha 248]|uniref:Mid2 domain-containing protein n=1 Tax=Drechslerella stenobrocha 248 TaxID=1043628 RepID=W7I8C5_9PEZI|nr:hypothetical protein DRE_01770 [Drechslerella stenobrocha 248]